MDVPKDKEKRFEGKSESRLNYKRGKPPDKRRHQMEINQLTEEIQRKEACFKSLNASKSRKSTSSVHGSRDELLAKLRDLKNKKEQKMKQKQVIDAEIKALNEQVRKKSDSCMKLQANVKYKDEQRTNNAIKNLERHLSTQQLKLREEKKLVLEIDALKRSKKTLSEYLDAKQEVDRLRQQQNGLRNERDTLIRETHDIRAKENDVKVSLDSLKEEETAQDEKKSDIDRDALKKEIDELYEQRREAQEKYKQALANYYEEQKNAEKEIKAEQRRDETRLTKMTAERTRQGKRHEPKPHKEEKNICVCLIQYLEPFTTQCFSEIDEVDGNRAGSKYLDVPRSEASIPEEGSLAMNPDDNLGGLFVPSNRRMTRKGSRKGRKSAQKLVLHPHVFELFFKLGLEPPSTYADVNLVLEKLRVKKDFYEKESSKCKQPLSAISENLAGEVCLEDEPLLSQNSEQTPTEATMEHEETNFKHDMDEAQHEIAQDKHETGHAEHVTEQTQRELEQFLHEPAQTEHEVDQLVHEDDHVECDVQQSEHESKMKEHEMIKKLNESHELVNKDIDDEEMDVFKNERSCCKQEELATENMLNKSSAIITDALEKGMDNMNMKDTSPEIQVRVT